ncbi:hypothetical protein Brsp07_02796 [Brucella sp. NBRC 14130]|uniref:Fic/DOC family N-terminal domain-containing protein n=2 Tax=Brucella/Ochrobactrum group TaxID=2826938 RepID=UPI002795D15E|nr:Fic/DOC family N-terminal domain-containing protein [Brucella intermedia]
MTCRALLITIPANFLRHVLITNVCLALSKRQRRRWRVMTPKVWIGDSELFLAPLRRQDAVSSSRMEGTISTIEELYRLEAEEDAGAGDYYREARNDDIETFLYARALSNAQQALADGAP